MKKLLLGVCLLSSLTFAAKIEVIGQGVVKTAPNVIQTNLGIQTQKETVQDAMETNQKLISSLYEKLIALGIEKKDIVTSQFYLNYYKNEDKKDVYTVSNNLEIKIRDSLHQYISGSNQMMTFGQIRFIASATVNDQMISSTHG